MKKWWLDTSHAFVEILAERKKKKGYSLAMEKMRDRPIDGDQKLKKKGTKRGTVCVGWKKKIPGKFYHIS